MKMNTQQPKVWETAKAGLRRKFIALQAYLKKQEKSQINNLTLHLKELEEKQNPKWVEEIIQRRNKWNRVYKTIQKVNETKSWFIEKIRLTNFSADSSRKREREPK